MRIPRRHESSVQRKAPQMARANVVGSVRGRSIELEAGKPEQDEPGGPGPLPQVAHAVETVIPC